MSPNVKGLQRELELSADFTDRVGDHPTPVDQEASTEMLHHVVSEFAEVLTDPDAASAAIIAQLTLARKRLGQARQVLSKIPGMGHDLAVQEALTEVTRASGWIEEARACLKEPIEGPEFF